MLREVVVQGVRRFGDVRRFALGPGYNVLYGLSAAGKSTLFDVLLSLLFARPREGEAESFKSLLPQGQSACRAGMTLELGGESWRVLKDYLQGSVNLSRYLAAEKRFELVTDKEDEIVRWLRETAGIHAGPSLGNISSLGPDDLPSKTEPVPVATVRRDGSGTDMSMFEERLRGMTLPEKKQLLVTLQEEYRRHAEMKTSEFLQDGLRSKLFEVEALLKKREDAREKIAELDIELKDIVHLPKLPDGIDERIEAYKRHEKTREAELQHLLPRQEDSHRALEAVIPYPFTEKDMRRLKSPVDIAVEMVKKDRMVDAGLGSLGASVIASFFGGPVTYVAILLAITGIGLVAYRSLFVFLRAKEQFDAIRRTVDAVDEQVRLVERKWDIETTVVRNLMKAYDADDPREMKEIESRRDELVAKKQEHESTIDGLKLPSGDGDLDGAHARLTKQIASIDERLQALSDKFTTDPKDLEPQIERLDREVARAEGRRATPRSKLFGLEEEGDDEEPARNAIAAAVDAWCASRRIDMGKLLRSIQEVYSHNVRALSGGKLAEAQFDATGSISVREEGRPSVPFETLEGLAKDMTYLALRITLAQLDARGAGRTLLLLDDPFEYEDARLAVLSRALKSLGPNGQVVHLTSKPLHQRLAHHQAEI